ncbi:MAG: iron complex outermembrane receptor protein [Halioglobus sp.]|jgi:iron complex outermembrane receptor protein
MKKSSGGTRFYSQISIPLLFTTSLLSAQYSFGAVNEADFFADIPIVTSATRLPQQIDKSPVAITYIDQAMIAASGATEISEILKLAPGFLSYSVLGNQFGVTNRGLSYAFPGDLEITIDGRSVYVPLFSTVEWTSLGITPEDIEYMEVVRGSNAAAYGSNAFLGAIHIVTNRPAREEGLSLKLVAGDIKTRNGQLDYSGKLGLVDYSMGLVYRHNEGFPSFTSDKPEDRNIDGNEAASFRFEAIATPTINDTLRFHTGLGKTRIELPTGGLAGGDTGFHIREIVNNYQMLRWQRLHASNDELQIQFYHNRAEFDEVIELGLLSSAIGLPPELIPALFPGQVDEEIMAGDDDALSETYDLEVNQSFTLGGDTRGVVGIAARLSRVRSEFLLNRRDTVDAWSYRQFTNVEHSLSKRLQANVGLMAEENKLVGTVWSPRLAFNYSFSNFNTLRVSASRGNRIPSILEAFQDQALRFSDGTVIEGDVITDPNIRESIVTEYDIGYVGSYFQGKLTADIRLLQTEAEDIIDDSQTGPAGFAVFRSNFIDWKIKGWDTQLKYRFSDFSNISLQYAYTDFDGEHRGRSRVKGAPPRHIASLLASTRLMGLDLSATMYYNSEVQWQEGDRLDSNFRTDLRIAKRFSTSVGDLGVELIGKSVFDSYAEYEKENRFEPGVFFKLSFKPD